MVPSSGTAEYARQVRLTLDDSWRGGWVPVQARALPPAVREVAAVFAHLTAWLRATRPGAVLRLAPERLGELAGVSARWAANAIRRLLRRGVLRQVGEAPQDTQGRPASFWEWVGELPVICEVLPAAAGVEWLPTDKPDESSWADPKGFPLPVGDECTGGPPGEYAAYRSVRARPRC
jgi:hypothetical protein